LYVGDCRFPTLSVCPLFLHKAKVSKTILLGLNKCDLVPKSVSLRWAHYYRTQGFQCVAFSCSERLSTSRLRQKISMLAGKAGFASVDLGVVGYPNVGKSSLVNILYGRHGVSTSPSPGHTKSVTKLRASDKLVCWDTPGVTELGEELAEADKLVLGIVPVTELDDPIEASKLLANRLHELNPEAFKKAIGGKFEGADAFIEQYSKKAVRLLKGGIRDEVAGPLKFLNEYYSGKIKVWELPPEFSDNQAPDAETGEDGTEDER